MKVILIEEMDNLGQRGVTVNVADGYARNYLIPKKLAIPATPGNLKYVENQRLVWAKQESKLQEEAEILAGAIGEVTVAIEKKVGEGDSLYGSVTSIEIAELLNQQGFQVDRRKIRLEHPIKTLGEYTVPIKLHREVTAEIKVVVNKEGGDDEPVVEEAAVPTPDITPETEVETPAVEAEETPTE